MRVARSHLLATFLLGTAGILAVLGVAALLVVSGHMTVGAKVAAYVLLLPGVPILAASLMVRLRDPGRHRTTRDVEAVLVAAGGLLVLVPVLAWLPFGPMHLHIGRLPIFLAVPFVIGVGLVAAGVSSIFLESLVSDWRDREYADVAANLIAVAVVLWIASWLVANRLG
jgi:hypothetical protein